MRRWVWFAVAMTLSAAPAAAAGEAVPAGEDGRYHLELSGAAGVWSATPGASSEATRPKAEDAAEPDARGPSAGDAAGAAPLLVLERSGGAWAATLCGEWPLSRGIVRTEAREGAAWRITVDLLMGGLPRARDWLVKDPPVLAECRLTFAAKDGRLAGSWEGTIGGTAAAGRISGYVTPLRAWPLPPAPKVGEHPRFLLRREDLPALRAKARTPWGQAMLKRLEQPGWSRSGLAVAQGLLYQLTGDRRYADRARDLVDEDIASGWWRTIGPIHDPAHKATEAMFAYDLIHETCDAAYHERMRAFLRSRLRFLFDYAEINSGNGHPYSNWSAQYRSAVGMVALALVADPSPPPEPPAAWDFPTVSPPAGFRVVDGMPVLPADDCPLRQWLYAGPFNIGLGHDALETLGGTARARPTAGTTFKVKVKEKDREDQVSGKYPLSIQFKNARPRPKNQDVLGDDLQPLSRETTGTFVPCPAAIVVGEKEYTERFAAQGKVHLWRAAGCRSFQTVYFFAVLDNPAPRYVQVMLSSPGEGDWKYPDSCLYISGRRFNHADVLLLDRGRHPVLRQVTVAALCDAHGRHHLYDDVWLQALEGPAVARARTIHDTERQFRVRCVEALRPRFEDLGRPDLDALLWLPVARRFMDLYSSNAIGDRGWNIAGQCYTQHPLRVAQPFAHAWRNATGTEVGVPQHLGWFLGQAACRTVFSDEGARMQDYGRGGGPVGVDLFGRGFGNVPPEIRPAVFWAWKRTLDLTDRGRFHAPEGAVEELDPMSAAFTFVNWPLDLAARVPEANPSAVLPRAVVDTQRLGYTLRNRWQDGDDVVALFTGFHHPGGDWASEGAKLDLRLMGLGTEWVVRGNGHVGDWTSTVAVEGAGEPQDVEQRSFAPADDGSAAISLSYRLGGTGSGLRCLGVDYSGVSGAAALLALVDRIHFTPLPGKPAASSAKPAAGRSLPTLDQALPGGPPTEIAGPAADQTGANQWRLVTDISNQVTADPDGFTISGAGGAVLKGVVVAPAGPKVHVADATHKIEINYRYDHQISQFTRRVVTVDGKDVFFVVLVLSRGTPPPVKVEGEGLNAKVTVGRQRVRFDGGRIVLGD